MFAYVRYYSNVKFGSDEPPVIVRKKEIVTSIPELKSMIFYLDQAHKGDKYYRLVEPRQTIRELESTNDGMPVQE